YAEDYEGVDVAYATPRQGRDNIRQTMSLYLQAFPDLSFTIEELVVQDNHAALAWIGRGTHQGKIMNIPPTGREVMVRGTTFFTIHNCQITHGLHVWDVAGVLRSIGLLPEL
ncbi:MAG: ester cyclase, partial [Chloroflexi bacterium]|nr:ester cyclase [Chloroflexota bacterium]